MRCASLLAPIELQHQGALLVADLVVDRLEVIEVDEHH